MLVSANQRAVAQRSWRTFLSQGYWFFRFVRILQPEPTVRVRDWRGQHLVEQISFVLHHWVAFAFASQRVVPLLTASFVFTPVLNGLPMHVNHDSQKYLCAPFCERHRSMWLRSGSTTGHVRDPVTRSVFFIFSTRRVPDANRTGATSNGAVGPMSCINTEAHPRC